MAVVPKGLSNVGRREPGQVAGGPSGGLEKSRFGPNIYDRLFFFFPGVDRVGDVVARTRIRTAASPRGQKAR